ncbi:MMPL family transporter [Streptomyces sp. YIM 98790]|uniref:MMPL family transporter n=1 Tax=Streptomyces sp. YIM 98790 TaxID=2689077 RepID=UPI00140AF47F|nr:MMPL family transporter [Streptomyces sp. YIM 98790]
MATFLYRLGRWSYRRRRLVLALWLALLAATGAVAAALSEESTAIGSSVLPGTESQRALDLVKERFPEQPVDGASARVVFAAPEGQELDDPGPRQAVESVVGSLGEAPQVAYASDPFQTGAVSEDGRVGYSEVTYAVPGEDVTDDARDALTSAVEAGRDAGLTVEVGGDALEPQPELSVLEIVGVVIAGLVLIVALGSFVAAGLPLLTAFVGVGIGLLGIAAVGSLVTLNRDAAVLALMLGLAVSIDYALFIVMRHRSELAAGREPEEAAGRAVGTAGSAVVFAGLTVIIALAGLSVLGIPLLTEDGLAAAGTIAVVVLVALTLMPALLGFAGRRVTGRGGRILGVFRGPDAAATGRPTAGRRWAELVTRRPRSVLLIGVLTLGVIALPAADLRLGIPDDGTAAEHTTQRRAYDMLAESFGPGVNGPLVTVVDAAGADDPRAAAERTAELIGGLPRVAAVAPPAFNEQGDTALVEVTPAAGPAAEETEELVAAIRERTDRIEDETGAVIEVTGQTALDIDSSAKMGDALRPYLSIIVGLALVLLLLAFRSVLIPVKATIGYLLTVAATFGAVVAVFQWGWLSGITGIEQTAPIYNLLPILLVGMSFGLAMDYQVFLVTRMREEYAHGTAPGEAVVAGFAHGARVVTAAAVIMISVFLGFFLSEDLALKLFGFTLAAAVLFDAFVVRMTLMPAGMALLGRSVWWLPRRLDRVLPHADIEGVRLQAGTGTATPGNDETGRRPRAGAGSGHLP